MSATARPVRDDQHGTITGYNYGCRCDGCRTARREYGYSVSAEVLDRVFAALEWEADLDGLATASGERIGELADVSQVQAARAIHRLAEEGRVSIHDRVGRGGVLEVQINEEATR